jgi:prepilin-type N-terminal cleavage/methylation domain-containing protein
MDRKRAQHGFSLIEMMVVVGLLGVFAAVAGILMGDSMAEARAKAAVRSLADLLMLGRTEAIRTGDNHIVFFFQDTTDSALAGPSGGPAAALLIRDSDADGLIDSGERVAAVYLDDTGSLSWGSTFAANLGTPAKAPNDNPDATFPEGDADFLCCTFLDPDDNPARWVVFLPDGLPRAFKTGPFSAGNVTSGNGAVYVTSGSRDYAVVLAPLGGVRVHGFMQDSEGWRQ